MLDDLDRTVEELLKRELPPALIRQVSMTFATPSDQFPPTSVTLPAIDLFLYDVRENRDLRSVEWQVERQPDGTALKRRPPVRVECSYLVTAWSSGTSTTPVYDEHRLLGDVMKVLLRHPSLPDVVLQGALRGQLPPLPTAVLQPGHLQGVGQLWQALGGKPKAALNYTVTFGVEADRAPEAAPAVVDKILKVRHGEVEA